MKLHLGAFNMAVDGWVNTDITPHLWVARVPGLATILYACGLLSKIRWDEHRSGAYRKLKYLNLTKPLPFESASVDAIFSSHVFEHLFLDEVKSLIAECHRTLAPGGVIRVVVPDLEKIVSRFDPRDPEPFLYDIYEIGSRSAVKNSHHCGFTGAYITDLFRRAGFAECYVRKFREGRCPDIEKLDNRPESLFFEAVK